MAESYEFKYDTGKRMLHVFGFASLFVILMMFLLPSLIILFAVCLSLTGALFIKARQNYQEILLYEDKMQMTDIGGTVLMEVYFAEIKRVGFLHGLRSSGRYGTYAGGVDVEEFIIMFNDGSEFKIDDDDFDDIREIAAYVKQKIGQEN